MHLSDAHHFRKMVAGVCMVVSPLLLLASTIIQPALYTDTVDMLRSVGGHRDAWYIAQLLGMASIVLAVPATLGFMHMLRERQVAAGHVGGGLSLVGLMAFAFNAGLLMVMWQMAQPGADRRQMVLLLNRVQDTTGSALPLFILGFAFTVGMVVLAYGLYAARAVSPLIAACVAVGTVAMSVGFPAAIDWLTIAGSAVLAVGICSIGTMVLRETDAEWEHTPELRGFGAAAGMP